LAEQSSLDRYASYFIYLACLIILNLVDGALDPPHFYISRAEIDAALRAAGREVPTHFSNNEYVVRDDPLPTQAGPVVNAPLLTSNTSAPMLLAAVAPPAPEMENGPIKAQGKPFYGEQYIWWR
jgi:hypothetical protein